jgi:hypothetical protein
MIPDGSEQDEMAAQRKFSSEFAKWWERGAVVYRAEKASSQNAELNDAVRSESSPTIVRRVA